MELKRDTETSLRKEDRMVIFRRVLNLDFGGISYLDTTFSHDERWDQIVSH